MCPPPGEHGWLSERSQRGQQLLAPLPPPAAEQAEGAGGPAAVPAPLDAPSAMSMLITLPYTDKNLPGV